MKKSTLYFVKRAFLTVRLTNLYCPQPFAGNALTSGGQKDVAMPMDVVSASSD